MQTESWFRSWGPDIGYSYGTSVIMADRQIRRALEHDMACLEKAGSYRNILWLRSGKCFVTDDILVKRSRIPTAMMGAACGDVAGSVYEHHNIKYKPDPDRLIHPRAYFTDDTVMTCAVAEGIRRGLQQLPTDWLRDPAAEQVLLASIESCVRDCGRKYPHAGYGGAFRRWLSSPDPRPYNSWGNGSAMRASYAGWIARTLEEAEKLGELSARITHDHPEGIKGAVVVAGCIFLLRSGASKEDIREYAGKFYDLDFTLDGIRADYAFDVSCQGSVPQAIRAFLEGTSFSDVLACAISIGGDSDTIAAIAGSIAEVIYPIPEGVRGRVIDRMDAFLLGAIADAVDFMCSRLPGDPV